MSNGTTTNSTYSTNSRQRHRLAQQRPLPRPIAQRTPGAHKEHEAITKTLSLVSMPGLNSTKFKGETPISVATFRVVLAIRLVSSYGVAAVYFGQLGLNILHPAPTTLPGEMDSRRSVFRIRSIFSTFRFPFTLVTNYWNQIGAFRHPAAGWS